MGKKAKRQELSGFFDFFKKGPKQKSIFDAVGPDAGAMIQVPVGKPGLPALPKKEKRSIFSVMAPTSQLPAQIEKPSQERRGLSIFDVMGPKPEPPAQVDEEAAMYAFLKPREKTRPAPSQPIADLRQNVPVHEGAPPSSMFEAMSTEEPPTKYFFLRPSAPPEMNPYRSYGLPAPGTAPVVEWTLPSAEQLAEHFQNTMNLPGIWNSIRQARALPNFKIDQIAYYRHGIPMMIPIDPIVFKETYTDFANFYGIPWNVISMYLSVPEGQEKAGADALWRNVLSPLNATLPEAFEMLKPGDLPGFFNASFKEPKGEYWLNYIEPMLKRPEEPGEFSGA